VGLAPAAFAQWSNYIVVRQSPQGEHSRWPRINNRGEIVYCRQVNGQWQVFRTQGQATFPDDQYSDATSPAIADDGSFVCYRHGQGATSGLGYVLRYPGTQQIEVSRHEPGGNRDAGEHPSMSSDGRVIWWYSFFNNQTADSARRLFVSGRGQVSEGDYWPGDYPDVNNQGRFVYQIGGQIFPEGRAAFNGTLPNIGDAPADNPDIVYVNGTQIESTVMGVIGPGSWVDVNRSGIIVFEYFTNGFYQVFKGYPLPRIVSTGRSNATVGLPYQYDSDNTAEAYGYSETDDRFGAGPITWSIQPDPEAPPEFMIDSNTGEIAWTPGEEGTNRITIAAENNFGISTQLLTIVVTKPMVELVDAMRFRPQGSPELFTDANQYFSGGEARVGVVADGASRLIIRVPFEGFDPLDPNLDLRFAIESSLSSTGKDGLLRSISASSWALETSAEFSTDGNTYKAVCIYESPIDYEPASKPVFIQLRDGNHVIARKEIQIRRPPVVLVHGIWSSPTTWTALPTQLQTAGYDVYLVDYAFSSSSSFSENVQHVFERTTRAVAATRQSNYAASQADVICHSMGAPLTRLYHQSSSRQPHNYNKGDIHKLITIGGVHGGSYLASLLTALKAADEQRFLALRAVVAASSSVLWEVFPAIDIGGGAVEDLAIGSAALATVQQTPIPSVAISTTVDSLTASNGLNFILFLLGALSQGDGLVTILSQQGAISTPATLNFVGVNHIQQTANPTIATHVENLLRTSIRSELFNRFDYFPEYSSADSSLTSLRLESLAKAPPAFGNWLTLAGATNGQLVVPGESINFQASTIDGRELQAIYFVAPGSVVVVDSTPFDFPFQVPLAAIGPLAITAAARDNNGQLAVTSIVLTATGNGSLLRIATETNQLTLTTPSPRRVRVLGEYSDGIWREISGAAAGTGYGSSDRFRVRVDTNGILRAVQNTVAPITIWITNGTVWTNIQVTVDLVNLPPTAVLIADKTNGPAPLDIRFDGSRSEDAEQLPVTHHWDFGDGTTSEMALPPVRRFLVPGQYTVTLTVTDPQGLISIDRFIVTVEPRLVLNGSSLTLPQALSYDQVIVTNGGSLITTTNPLEIGTMLIDGTNSFFVVGNGASAQSVVLTRGGTITAPQERFLDLRVSNLWIDASSRIEVSGKGYAGGIGSNGSGPGGGQATTANHNYGGGASYGGVGGGGFGGVPGPVYGVFDNPVDFGSGGGWGYGATGGNGGGAIRLEVQQLQLDGEIAADGIKFNNFGGGGSGGSIHLTVGTLRGSGSVHANGGGYSSPSDSSLAGGGGRVAVFYMDKSSFSGKLEAKGGVSEADCCPFANGGAGTVYLKQSGEAYGELIIDNGGTETVGWSTPLSNAVPIELEQLRIGGSARVDGLVPVQLHSGLVSLGSNNLRVFNGSVLGDLTLSASNQLQFDGAAVFHDLVVTNRATLILNGMSSANALLLRSNAVLTVPAEAKLELTVSNVWMDASSRIDVNGKGYAGGVGGSGDGKGPGGGRETTDNYGGGASYGGIGGNGGGGVPGPVYGVFGSPVDFGSGGGWGYGATGGNGGGAIRLEVQQLQLDGEIAADGIKFNNLGGGGSGGSIHLTVGTLRGSGRVHANGGGYTNSALGGGGGRVGIFYADKTGFAGNIEAKGGMSRPDCCSYANGGAGTIYLKQSGATHGELIIDNGGTETTDWSTPLSNAVPIELEQLRIGGSARVDSLVGLQLHRALVSLGTSNLRVITGSVLKNLTLSSSNRLQLTGAAVFDDLAVSSGATLILDGVGYANAMALRSNAVLTVPGQVGLELNVDSLAVDASSRIEVNGKGYAGGVGGSGDGKGPGGGKTTTMNDGGGGSYGGMGGNGYGGVPGAVYGAFDNPVDFGSGGGHGYAGGHLGGNGGGAIRLQVQELQLDGEIGADGMKFNTFGGGGSGGSIHLTVGTLRGTGRVHANGGGYTNLGSSVPGGGGGRVAIFYTDKGDFAGTIEARGGVSRPDCCPEANGGAGTIYLKQSSTAYGELIIDNGGTETGGWSTPIAISGNLRLHAWPISGKARVLTDARVCIEIGDAMSFATLIASNLLSVRALLVSNRWVHGDISKVSLVISSGRPLVTTYGQSNIAHELQGSINLIDWISIATNTLPSGSFQYLDTNGAPGAIRGYRGLRQ
jgi:PKD repeat protein/pimeloyl-ACP methyl ester carboxylesterase